MLNEEVYRCRYRLSIALCNVDKILIDLCGVQRTETYGFEQHVISHHDVAVAHLHFVQLQYYLYYVLRRSRP